VGEEVLPVVDALGSYMDFMVDASPGAVIPPQRHDDICEL